MMLTKKQQLEAYELLKATANQLERHSMLLSQDMVSMRIRHWLNSVQATVADTTTEEPDDIWVNLEP